MALQKEINSKTGVTGNYIAVHAMSYDNERKSLAYSVALYLDEEAKRGGAEPLQIIYQGRINAATPDDMIGQCYADMKEKAAEKRIIELPPLEEGGEPAEKEIPAYPAEYELFNGAEDA